MPHPRMREGGMRAVARDEVLAHAFGVVERASWFAAIQIRSSASRLVTIDRRGGRGAGRWPLDQTAATGPTMIPLRQPWDAERDALEACRLLRWSARLAAGLASGLEPVERRMVERACYGVTDLLAGMAIDVVAANVSVDDFALMLVVAHDEATQRFGDVGVAGVELAAEVLRRLGLFVFAVVEPDEQADADPAEVQREEHQQYTEQVPCALDTESIAPAAEPVSEPFARPAAEPSVTPIAVHLEPDTAARSIAAHMIEILEQRGTLNPVTSDPLAPRGKETNSWREREHPSRELSPSESSTAEGSETSTCSTDSSYLTHLRRKLRQGKRRRSSGESTRTRTDRR